MKFYFSTILTLLFVITVINKCESKNKKLNINCNLSSSSNLVSSLIGESINSKLGNALASAGDVNGDGINDLIIGAQGFKVNTGKVIFILGNSNMNLEIIKSFTGVAENNLFGCTVSTAGDVNGDGYDDILIGARNAANNGAAYLYFGSNMLDSIYDHRFVGGDNAGISVGSIGDFNNDGYSDFFFSSYSMLGVLNMIKHGNDSIDNSYDLLALQGGGVFYGNMITIGDINGDGYDDIITESSRTLALVLGSSLYVDYVPSKAFSRFNSTFFDNKFISCLSNSGDMNGDGVSDFVVGIDADTNKVYIFQNPGFLNGIPDVIIREETNNTYFGHSVANAGDINNDGFADVIFSDKGYDNNRGRVYILCGGPNKSNQPNIVITGETENSLFGSSLSTAGDMNNDGFDEVLIGASGYDSSRGKAYLFTNLIPSKTINPQFGSSNNFTTVNLIWTKSASNSFDVLTVSTDSTFASYVIKDTIHSDTSKIISSLQRETKYFWKIESSDKGIDYSSEVSNFKTYPVLRLNVKMIFEGMYSPLFNLMNRKDTVTVFLRSLTAPYSIVDSARGIVDSLNFTSNFTFEKAASGTYLISVKHSNSLETWSKSSGITLLSDGYTYSYNFTTISGQAYGNNLVLINDKWCLYSGDVDGNGSINLSDLTNIYNKSATFSFGYQITDLNADNIVNLSDLLIGYTNTVKFVTVKKPE